MARLKKGKTKRTRKKKQQTSAVRLDEYEQLAEKVDAFFERVQGRYGAQMRCASGCSDCCGHQLTISVVEAEAMARALATRDAETRRRLAARAAALAGASGPCPALEADGRCAVYEARPLVCRSHGVPMHVPAQGALPVLNEGLELEDGSRVACCHLNFTTQSLDEVAPDCVLDLVNMAATLAVVNARAIDAPAGDGQTEALRRVLIGDVLLAAHSP